MKNEGRHLVAISGTAARGTESLFGMSSLFATKQDKDKAQPTKSAKSKGVLSSNTRYSCLLLVATNTNTRPPHATCALLGSFVTSDWPLVVQLKSSNF
jgi:hypothetical protein